MDSPMPPPSEYGRPSPISERKIGIWGQAKRKNDKFWNALRGFAEASPINGMSYIFEKGQNAPCRFFWIMTVITAFSLACIWSKTAFDEWQANPILTSVKTTGLPIKDIEHPAIIICSQGANHGVLASAFADQIFEYHKSHGDDIAMRGSDFQTISEERRAFYMEVYRPEYLEAFFPGLKDGKSPLDLIDLMSSKNPESLIQAEVAKRGGYNPCNKGYNHTEESAYVVRNCPNDTVKNPKSGFCYKIGDSFDDTVCEKNSALMIQFFNDTDVQGFTQLIKNGNLSMNPSSWFRIHAWRNDDNKFAFEGNYVAIQDSFSLLRITKDQPDEKCLKGRLGVLQTGEDYIELQSFHCYEKIAIICQEWQSETVICEADDNFAVVIEEGNGTLARKKRDSDEKLYEDFVFYKSLDFMLNPALKEANERAKNLLRADYKNAFDSINITTWYEGLFKILWYTHIPCYDVKGVTSTHHGQWSLLKQCKWKGVKIPCSAIFETFPTDRGMCCAFNMKKANAIFKQSKYTEYVEEMQRHDKNGSFEINTLPQWYLDNNEPKAQTGKHKGLTIMVDSHNDYVHSSTVNEDFFGFEAYVSAGDSFPLTHAKGFRILAGHENLVAIKAVDVQTDLQIQQDVDPSVRKCYFPDEVELKLHNNYSQANCKLECAINYAQNVSGIKCTPWYFPTQDNPIKMCNPWEAILFDKLMFDNIPDEQCAHCLPDCSETMFSTSITVSPFRRCDYKNLGVSYLCNLNDPELPQPRIWGYQVIDEYLYDVGEENMPDYVKLQVKNSERRHMPVPTQDSVFNYMNTEDDKDYQAYEKDIAIVEFYFDSSTIFQYHRESRLTLIGFISQIGGLLGLCIGCSIVSIIELVYWCLYKFLFSFADVPKMKRKESKVSNTNNEYSNTAYKRKNSFPMYLEKL